MLATMADIPSTEPAVFTAGDTLKFTRSLAAYPASAGWVLSYTLVNATAKISFSASASGDDHLVNVAVSTTTGWAAGAYSWVSRVTLAGEVYTVSNGTITILPNLAAVGVTAYDGRSDARIILDSLLAAYKAHSVAGSAHIGEYEIAGRRMKYRNAAEILQQISHWQTIVAAEERAERINKGLKPGNRLLVRF
jgi:hypothetical protein